MALYDYFLVGAEEMWEKLITLILVFAIGTGFGTFITNESAPAAYTTYTYTVASKTSSLNPIEAPAERKSLDPVQPSNGPIEQNSPGDWVKEKQIEMRSDGVLIKINNPQWAILTDTNSMDPVFDETSHLIQVIPESPKQVKVGDIVSYRSPLGFTIVHRATEIGEDEEGWYAILKGDNNPLPDPWKVRWDMVRRVTVMVVY